MHGRLARAALGALLLLVPAASAAAAVPNDVFQAAKPLPIGAEDATVDNSAFTVQPGEPFTAQGAPGADACNAGNVSTQVDRTAWWTITGTGRPVTVTVAGDGFDTVLGIFPPNDAPFCQDARGSESLGFGTIAGQTYRIQVGSCAASAPNGCNPPGAGTLRVRATSPGPANDARGAATPLSYGQPLASENYAATEEPGEIVSCGLLPYGRTVWYRLGVPATGEVRVAVDGANPSLAVFTSTGRRVGCDATPGPNAQVVVPTITAGDLLVQVGGVGAHAGLVADSVQGPFAIRAAFTPAVVHKPAPKQRHRITARARLAVALSRRSARVRSLAARNVPAGAKVQLLCSGRSCPFKRSRARTVRRAHKAVSLMSSRLRRAHILPVTTFEVRVTRAGSVGSVVRYRFSRPGRAPVKTTLCLVPGAKRPSRCTT